MLREELKKRIEKLKEEIASFDYRTKPDYRGDYEQDTYETLERLEILFRDLDY